MERADPSRDEWRPEDGHDAATPDGRARDLSLSPREAGQVDDRVRLSARAVYATVMEEGEEQLARPAGSLLWSGLTAGLAMGFSVLTLALINMHLPDATWAPLVSSFGYAAGFLIVVIGRLQLFTESTITAVLPVTAHFGAASLGRLLRLWTLVLLANFAGCVIIAYGFMRLGLVPADVAQAILAASEHLVHLPAMDAFLRGIGAGFLIAALVWMTPSAEGGEVILVTIIAWLIALGGFTHIIAGAVETAALVIAGRVEAPDALIRLVLPILAGNIIGGSALFALLSYAQVKAEIDDSAE
jgi:formate/nitrite transporter FocA (FNT family)